MPDDLTNYLQGTQIPQGAKADAWEAFSQSQNEAELQVKLQGMKIPDKVKADLWEMKHSAAPNPAAQTGAFQSKPGGPIQNASNIQKPTTQKGAVQTGLESFMKSWGLPEQDPNKTLGQNIGAGLKSVGSGMVDLAKRSYNATPDISPTYTGGAPVGGVLKLLLTPVHALSYGIEGAASNIEGGGGQVIQGIRSGDTNQIASGIGQGVGGLTQVASMKGQPESMRSSAEGLVNAATKTTPSTTLGIEKGGVAATVERLANKLPVSAQVLSLKYGAIADSFRSDLSSAVEKATGVKGDPANIVKNMQAGSAALDTQAKALYKPVDDYVSKNAQPLVQAVLKSLPPEVQGSLPNTVFDSPINGLKGIVDSLQKKGNSLVNSGLGIQGHSYLESAKNVQATLDGTIAKLPPELQTSLQQGDAKYMQARAMEDTADTFNKNVSGIEPSRQGPGVYTRQQTIQGGSLLDALKDNKRFAQAFGKDTAEALVRRADELGLSQKMSGQGGAGIGQALFGAGMLYQAMRGFVNPHQWGFLGAEVGGTWILGKVLSTPEAIPFYQNMLKASTPDLQNFWATRAVDAAMKKEQQKGNQ